jgi:tetratricopeptide (TPR) repeat protein
MKLNSLLRLMCAAGVGAFVLAASPALSAQTADELVASGTSKMSEYNYDGAIADFTKVIELKPADLSGYYYRGLAETGQGNFDGAINDFSQVIRFRTTDASGYLQRGKARYLQGNIDGAVEDIAKAIELKPKDGAAYFYLALAKDAQSNLDEAVANYSKTIELKTGGDPSLIVYATLFRAQDYNRQGRAGQETFETASSWKSKWERSLAAFVMGKLPEAELLSRAGFDVTDDGEKAHERSEAYYFAGVSRLLKGDKAGAQKAFNESFVNEPPSAINFRQARSELDHMPH